jgi:hypothetical protein
LASDPRQLLKQAPSAGCAAHENEIEKHRVLNDGVACRRASGQRELKIEGFETAWGVGRVASLSSIIVYSGALSAT